jgi:hypothetical protein
MDCRVKDEDEGGNMRIPQKHVSLEKHERILNKGGVAGNHILGLWRELATFENHGREKQIVTWRLVARREYDELSQHGASTCR